MPDLIDLFLEYTDGARSPQIFRLWSAIALVAGALERRVWLDNGQGPVFANMFTLLVAPPGVGKFVVELVRRIWSEACQPGTKQPAFHVAPDNMTNASLIDRLSEATTTYLTSGGLPIKYNSLLVAAEEFSVLLPKYDMEYIGTLNKIWNNIDKYEERRRTGSSRKTEIVNPQLNMLGGVQPTYLASVFPEDAWSTGLGRRLFMVYASETPKMGLFHRAQKDEALYMALTVGVGKLWSLYGQFEWDDEAASLLEQWFADGDMPDKPTHTKLVNYNRSRPVFALKLSLISAVARDYRAKRIVKDDVDRALGWLLQAERVMPDIFRAMVGKSDKDVIGELHMYMMSKYGEAKRKGESGIPIQKLRQFLLERVPHEKVETLLKAAEAAHIIDRVGGTQDIYIPKPRYGGTVE